MAYRLACARAALLFVPLVLVGALLPGQARAAGIEDEIRRIEGEISIAYAANDLPRYFAFYADDLRALFDDGPTTLPKYRKDWTAFIKGGGAVLAFSISDLVVQVSPASDVAVASYRAKARIRDTAGKTTDGDYFETDVFFHRENAWKIAEIHYSAAPPAQK